MKSCDKSCESTTAFVFRNKIEIVDKTDMKNVVLAIPVKNCAKFLPNLMRQIDLLNYPKEHLSLAFVENDSTDTSWLQIQAIEQELRMSPYRSVKIEKRDIGYTLPHESRHLDEVQKDRIKAIISVRQHMVDTYLEDNDYLFWIDSDYIYIPPNTISELLRPNLDIVVPLLFLPGGQLYDHTTCKFEGGVVKKAIELIKENPGVDYVRVDLANAPFMASRKAYQSARYICEDNDQEGPCFCRQAAKVGIYPYAALNVRIIHAPVTGSKPVSKGL